MDIKEKFKTFIDKQKSQKSARRSVSLSYLSGCDSWLSSDFDTHPAVLGHQMRKNSLCEEMPLSREAQDVVIDTIEPIYFQEDSPDVGSHELQKFPDIADVHVINGIRSRLRKQQAIVTRRVSDLIMDKREQCMQEMANIDRLQKEACMAVALCVQGRKQLGAGKEQLASASLRIIANHNKRQKILEVINNLKTIRTLQMTDIQLQKLLKGEDYPGAIQLLLECQKAAATFRHFTCVSKLSCKLQETLDTAERQLDSAIDRLVVNFNANTYAKLYTAYSMLGKRHTLLDMLHMHLTSHIHNSAFAVVLGYVELYNSASNVNQRTVNNSNSLNSNHNNSNNNDCGSQVSQSAYSKMQYSEICKFIDNEFFISCYLDLCKQMWSLLHNYKAVVRFHESEYDTKLTIPNNNATQSNENNNESSLRISHVEVSADSSSDNAVDESQYVKQKLEHGSHRLWQDFQAKIRTFILASDLSHFKLDEFLKVLDITSRLARVGESFCSSTSEALQESIKLQSCSVLQREHSVRLEELHMFLENEEWQVVPLKPTFTVYQLHEYRFLKTRDNSDRSLASLASPSAKQDSLWSLDSVSSPFELGADDGLVEEDILASSYSGLHSDDESDEDEDEESDLNKEFVEDGDDSGTGLTRQLSVRRAAAMAKLPIVSNTSLALLRLLGKYLRMMKLLRPIAGDVFVCLTQLVHYYIYTICNTFGLSCSTGLSSRLSGLLQRIERDLILTESREEERGQHWTVGDATEAKVCRARPSPLLLQHAPHTVEGVSARVVACESALLLHAELCAMRHVPPLAPTTAGDTAQTRMEMFYATLEEVLPEVVAGVYGGVGASVVPQAALVQQMAAVSWSVTSLESIHNTYVDDVVRQLQLFSSVLGEVRCRQPFPLAAERGLWHAVSTALHTALLHGYAAAKACTTEGRSLMQLDYQQLTSKLEPLCPGVRPLPGRDLVEGYIKAFYLPESALREWLHQHWTQYSARHLSSLVTVMGHVPKHARQGIVAELEVGE